MEDVTASTFATRTSVPWGRLAIVIALSVLLHAWLISAARHGFGDIDTERIDHPRSVQATLLRAPPPAAPPAPRPAPPRIARAAPPPRPAPAPSSAPVAPTPPLPSLAEVDLSALGVVEPAAVPVPAEPAAADASAESTPRESPVPPVAESAVASPAESSLSDLALELGERGMRGDALPARAEYVYNTRVSDISLVSATTRLTWALDGQTYEARLTSSAMGITLAELTSSGALQRFGLAPRRYTQKSGRRAQTAANFDWSARRVTFSARSHERPWREGMQDRLSFQFQLMALAQHLPERFAPGSVIVFPVASNDDVENYRFVVVGEEVVRVGEQDVAAVKVERPKDVGGATTRIEVWLAPSMSWLPVRLRFTERNNRVWENTLQRIEGAS